jgi:DNA-binding response OmpR family regulator
MKRQISGGGQIDDVFAWLDIPAEERLRILVAEDDPVSRRVLETTLMSYGFQVISAKDGEEAWNILSGENPPPMAILDWQMPYKDGLEICKMIRQTSRLDKTYVIILTANNSPADVVAGFQAGADDFMGKPYNRAELRARVQAGQRIVNLQKELIKAKSFCAECARPLAEQEAPTVDDTPGAEA